MCLKVSGTTLNMFLTLGIMIRVENLDQKMYCSDKHNSHQILVSVHFPDKKTSEKALIFTTFLCCAWMLL